MSARHCTVVDGSALLDSRTASPSFDGLLQPASGGVGRQPSTERQARAGTAARTAVGSGRRVPAERFANPWPGAGQWPAPEPVPTGAVGEPAVTEGLSQRLSTEPPAAERFASLLAPEPLAIEPIATRLHPGSSGLPQTTSIVLTVVPEPLDVPPARPLGRAGRPAYLRTPTILKATMAVAIGVALAASALRSQGSGDQAALQLSTGGASGSAQLRATPSPSRPGAGANSAGAPLRAVPVSLNGAAQLAAVPSPGTRQSRACRVTYTVQPQPPNDVLVQMKVTNASAVPVDGWAVAWSIPSGFRLLRSINATVMTNANAAVATAAAANRVIPAGGSTSIGFVGRYAGQASAYLELAPKGVSCA